MIHEGGTQLSLDNPLPVPLLSRSVCHMQREELTKGGSVHLRAWEQVCQHTCVVINTVCSPAAKSFRK